MSPQESLARHIEARPAMPQPFDRFTPEAIAWHRAFQWWVTRKEQLEMLATVPKTEDADRRPLVCRAEVEYARPAVRPAWTGSTKEYRREKQAEHRRKQSPEEKAKRLEARKVWDAKHRERKRLLAEARAERGVAA
jgi:hypothetical protein